MKQKCKIKQMCVLGSQGLESLAVRSVTAIQRCTGFCPPRHKNLVDLVDVDLLFTSPSQFKSICPKKWERDRKAATKQTRVYRGDALPFSFWNSVFCAQHFSWLQESTSRCAREWCLRFCFGWFFLRINSAASDATSARLSGGYRPVRSICFAGAFQTMSISITLLWQKLNFLWCIFVYPKCCCVLTGTIPFPAQQRHENTNSFQPKKGLEMDLGF